MSTYSSVVCYEEYGSVSENWSVLGGMESAQVTLRCGWSNRHLLVADILGTPRTWPGGSLTDPPQAQSCAISPDKTNFTATGQCINYVYALVTVKYSYKIVDLLSESLEPNADFVNLDYRRFRWGAKDGEPLLENEAPGKLRHSLTLNRTLYDQSSVPAETLTGIGKVNDADYVSSILGLTFEQGTLLYKPPVLDRVIRSNGSEGWTVKLQFSYKPEGWNKYWRPGTETYEEIWDIEGSEAHKNYPEFDFSNLLA